MEAEGILLGKVILFLNHGGQTINVIPGQRKKTRTDHESTTKVFGKDVYSE
jgi:hypothetical protein